MIENTEPNTDTQAAEQSQATPSLKDSPDFCDENTNAEATSVCKEKDDRAYFIEVLGFDHPEAQKVTVQPLEGSDNDTFFDFEGKPSEKQEKTATSTIHRWETMNDKPLAAQLEIQKAEGGTIKLPLFDDVELTKQRTDRQDHVIAPFVPVVQHFKKLRGKSLAPVSSRTGFLYLFLNGCLWREIKITCNQDAQPEFIDANIIEIKNGDLSKPIPEQAKREFSGKPLEEIWLPAWQNGRTCRNVRGFYSEVTLSNERLNYYHQDPRNVTARADLIRFDTPTKYQEGKQCKGLVQIDSLPEQRARIPELERLFSAPHDFLLDLTDSSQQQELQTAQKELIQIGKVKEYSQTSSALLLQLLKHQAGADNGDVLKTWQGGESQQDIFQVIKPRKICALVFNDQMELLRTGLQHVQTELELLQLLEQRSQQHEHYDFANLVQNLILPPFLPDGNGNKVANKYNEHYAKFVDRDEDAPLNSMLTPRFRRKAALACGKAQQSLASVFEASATLPCLTDVFALNNVEYLSGFHFLGNVLHAILINPNRLDSIYVSQHPDIRPYNTSKVAMVEAIFSEPGNPYYQLLFPQPEQIDLSMPLATSMPQLPNPGDGRCRVDLLHFLGQQEEKFKTSEHSTIDMEAFAEFNNIEASQPEHSSLAYLKRMFNDFSAIFTGMQGALGLIEEKVKDRLQKDSDALTDREELAEQRVNEGKANVAKVQQQIRQEQNAYLQLKQALLAKQASQLAAVKEKITAAQTMLEQQDDGLQQANQQLEELKVRHQQELADFDNKHQARIAQLKQDLKDLQQQKLANEQELKQRQQKFNQNKASLLAANLDARLKLWMPFTELVRHSSPKLIGQVVLIKKSELAKAGNGNKFLVIGMQGAGVKQGITQASQSTTMRNVAVFDKTSQFIGSDKKSLANQLHNLPASSPLDIHLFVVEADSDAGKIYSTMEKQQAEIADLYRDIEHATRTEPGFAKALIKAYEQHQQEKAKVVAQQQAELGQAQQQQQIAAAQQSAASDALDQQQKSYHQMQQDHKSTLDQTSSQYTDNQRRLASMHQASADELKARQISKNHLSHMITVIAAKIEEFKGKLPSNVQRKIMPYMDKILNHGATNSFIMGLEFFNVKMEIESASLYKRQGRYGRIFLGTTSALWDASLAIAAVLEKLASHQRLAAAISNFMSFELITAAEMKIIKSTPGFIGTLARAVLPRLVTVSLVLNLIGAALTVFVCAADTLYLWSAGDFDAAIAMGISTTAIGILGAAAWLGWAAWIPWVAGAVAIGALFVSAILKDSPMEQLLKTGPLAKNCRIKYLRNNGPEAYYRLVDNIAAYNITTQPNPYYQRPDLLPEGADKKLCQANWLVEASSLLPSLVGSLECQSHFAVEKETNSPKGTSWRLEQKDLKPLVIEPTSWGNRYYLYLQERSYGMGKTVTLRPKIWLQYQKLGEHAKSTTTNKVKWAFPAPNVADPLSFHANAAQHSQCDFDNSQNFWLHA